MTAVATLPPGFLPLAATPDRLILGIWGDAKDGKTTLGLSFPEPIFLLNFDFGYEGARARFPGKAIYTYDLPLNDNLDPNYQMGLLNKFHAAYVAALDAADAVGGTVVIDTITDLWKLVQSVKLERIREARIEKERKAGRKADPDDIKIYPFEYAQANLYMGGILKRAHHKPNVNAAFIGGAKGVYNDRGQETGQITAQWFNGTPGIVQGIIQVFTDQRGKVKGRVQLCRFDKTLEGMVLDEPSYTLVKGLFLPERDDDALSPVGNGRGEEF